MLNRIIDLLKKNNKKQADLAKFLKIPTGNLSNILQGNGRKFSTEHIPLIAEYFKVGTDYLYGMDINPISTKPVPITGTASCGSTELNCLQDNQMKTSINENKWNKDLYAVIACGDSMFPHIKDGAELIIDPTVKPTHGDTVLYKLDDEYAVKILTINKEAHIMEFVPLNPSEDFKTRMIRLDDEDTLSKLTVHYVLKINNPPEYNRSALLKMIGR